MTESGRQYDPRHLGNARALRREHTDAEGLLWSRLRDRGARWPQIPPPATDRSVYRGFRVHDGKTADRTRRRRPCGAEDKRPPARRISAAQWLSRAAFLEYGSLWESFRCSGKSAGSARRPPHRFSLRINRSASSTPPQGGSEIQRRRQNMNIPPRQGVAFFFFIPP